MEKDLMICILRHNGILACARAELRPGDITRHEYKAIYYAASQIYSAGGIPDRGNIESYLRKHGGVNDSMHTLLMRLSTEDTNLEATDIATALKQRGERLRTARYLADTAKELENGADLADTLLELRTSLDQAAAESVRAYTMEEAYQQALRDQQREAITTGFRLLDRRLLGGLWRGNVYDVAARPGMGKSLFAATLMKNAAKRGLKTGYISLEMSAGSINTRVLAQETGIPHELLQTELKKKAQAQKTAEIIRRVNSWPMVVVDPPSEHGIILRTIRALAAQGCVAIAVDYGQLISIRGFRGNRAMELAQITADLKSTARGCNVALVLVAQARRAHYDRRNKPPDLEDIKDSGSFEQDGDVVMMLHIPDQEATPRFIDLYIRKHRNGALGRLSYEMNPHTLRLDETRS